MLLKVLFVILICYTNIFQPTVATSRKVRQANNQYQVCITPNNYYGLCIAFNSCSSLVNYYGSSGGSQQATNYIIAAQRTCGTRRIGGEPAVCCQEAYRPQPRPTSRPTNQPIAPPTRPFVPPQTVAPVAPTAPPTPPPTRPPTAPPTQPPPTQPAARLEEGCRGPDFEPGNCLSLINCPSLLGRLQANPSDEEFAQFLRLSNAICKQPAPVVCCPLSGSGPTQSPATAAPRTPVPTSPPTQEQGYRLLTIQDDECGFSNSSHTKVVGGVDAKRGAWPWMALLAYEDNFGDRSFKCGGSLITRKHVLTAAHCITSQLRAVRLGEHDLADETESDPIDVNIIKVVRHPNYSRNDGHSDVAVLILERDVPLNYYIRPVCVPFQSQYRTKDYVGYNPFVAGWGKTQEGGKSATILQELQLPVLENSVCKERYRTQGKLLSEKQFDQAILCAGYLTGGRDSCQGDSGGPLMVAESLNGKFYFQIIGVVSYGIGCARVDVPAVYSSTQYFADWIQQQVTNTV